MEYMRDQFANKVRCLFCGASEGQECRTEEGEARPQAHADRVNDFWREVRREALEDIEFNNDFNAKLDGVTSDGLKG
jgi:hypothetical protein